MSLIDVEIGELEAEGYFVGIQDGNHGEKHPKSSEYVADGVPFIMASDISTGRVNIDQASKLPQPVTDKLRVGFCLGGDVLLSHKGSVGYVAIAPEYEPYLMLTPQVTYYRVNPKKVSARFLSYAFRDPLFQRRLASAAGEQGTRGYVGIKAQRRLKIRMCPPPMQDRIVAAVSPYDDLIENNRRRIALLEDAARMLYREWFVHFRFPGHEHVKIIDGLPEGWEHRQLRSCASFESGGTPSKARADFWDGDVPWISSGELTRMRIGEAEQNVTPQAVEAGSRYAEPDTILVVVRGMSLAKEFRMSIVSKRVCFNQDLKALVPDQGIEGIYLFHALEQQRDRLRQLTGEASHGTKKMETSVLGAIPIVVPLSSVRRHFLDFVEPLHAQWDALYQQNQKLSQARDLLLPRLMSGEIAV